MAAELAPLAPGSRILVTGAGITGRAVVAALASFDVSVRVCDDDAAARQELADRGVATVATSVAAAGAGDYDLVITSPGFPPTAPVLVITRS